MKKKNYFKFNQKFIFRLFSLLIIVGACSLNSFGQSPQTFNSSGTFTVPPGVTSITVSAWGGGGAGGGVDGQTKAGGGGEGGSFVRGTITVVSGATYSVIVGSGGSGVVAANGTSGQASSFSVSGGGATLFSAIGGVFGAVGNNFGAGGNAVNTGNIVSGTSTSNFYGGNGGTATNASSASSGGGGGSAGAGGNGGNGGTPSVTSGGTAGAGSGSPSDPGVVGATGRGSSNDGNGNDGGAPGAGGSGGRNANNGTDFRGGNGGNGRVIVTWSCPVPTISGHPSSQAICFGSPVTFSVTGTGSLTYQWKKAGVDISGATNSSFNITSVSAGDAASYTVVLTNLCGSVTSNGATLTVNSAPSISVDPISQTKCSGSSVTFSVTAGGTPTPTYQWRKDGVNISGATSASYNVASVTTGSAADYDVFVTNSCGNVTSNAATLTVNITPAAPAVSPSSATVIAGQSTSFTASGTETSFAWYSAASGGTLLGSNAVFNTPGSCSNASYFAEQTSSAGCTSTRTTAAVTATPLAAPTGSDGYVCGLGTATISGTPATGGNTCSWYAAASGGTALSVNSISYSTTINASGSLTYYASTKLSTLGCESTARTAVTATSLPEILATTTLSASSVCPGSLVTVGSSASRSGKSIVNVSIPFALLSTTNANSPLTVSGFSSALNNTSVKINYVKINITHNAVGSLKVRLVAPDASVFNLTNQNGSGANFTNTVFQTGGAAITSGTAPYTGTFAPQQAFSNFNGKNPNGTWTLNVQNVPLSAAGTLLNWEINFIDANGLTYSWTSTPAGVNSTSASITDNPSQNSSYNLVVNGPGGCSANGSASVSMLAVPLPVANTNAPICDLSGLALFGNNNAIGQSSGNTWSWKNPNNVIFSTSQNPNIGNATAANAGNYTLTVTNANGCTATATTQVIINPNPVLSIGTQSNVSCNGLSDGTVTLVATSGSSPYVYDLNGSSTIDGIYSGLVAGNYSASVIDDNSCEATAFSVSITQPAVLSFSSSSNNESCLGLANGSITISATGGTASYEYSIDNGLNFQNSNSFSSLSVGNYDLVIKDAHNCITGSASAVIGTTPDVTPPIIINSPVSISKCNDLTPVNWTAPTATDNCTTPVLTSNHNPGEIFPVGVTSVVYTADDGNGNTSTSSFDVIVNPLPTAVVSNNSVICLGGSAQLHLEFTGTGPWNYEVSDGSQNISGTASNSSFNITVIPPTSGDHNYSVTSVSDVNCTGTSSGTALVKVNTTAPPQNSISSINSPGSACNGDVILITATTPGGAGVSYSWNKGSSSSPVLFSENIGGPFTAGPLLTALPQVYAQFGMPGGGFSGYYVCAKAINGCGSSVTKCKWVRGIVSVPGAISPASGMVACPNDVKNYSCGASGGATIYTWTLNGSTAPISPNGGNNPTNVTVTFPPSFVSGQLCVTASLACGGSSVSAPKCMTITNNPSITGIITGPASICPGATGISYSVVPVTGASGYNWTVPSGVTIAAGAGTPSITVDFPTPYNGTPTICVTATSSCGAGAVRCKNVGSGLPSTPSGINGPSTNICSSTVQYSVVNPPAGLTYFWTPPAGTTILSGQGGSTILLNISPTFSNGSLTVVANSVLCAPATSSPRSINLVGKPATPGIITANPAVWCSGGYANFSVTPATPLPTYNWTVSNGTIDAGQGSNNIDVTWGNNVNGGVTVRASNGCGTSAASVQNFSSGCREEAINTSSEVVFSVYPNPAHDNVTLNFNSIEKENVHIDLIDLSGRAVQTVVYYADKGMNKVMIDLKKFSKGAYFIQIKSDKQNQQLPIILQ